MTPLSTDPDRAGSGQTVTVAATPDDYRISPGSPPLSPRQRPESPLSLPTDTRQCMALVPGSGGCLTDEVHCLLHRRLRIAGLIAWCGFTAILIRNFFVTGADAPTTTDMALHSTLVAVLTLVGGLLWSGYYLCMRTLRVVEGVMFGSMAAYFGYLQFRLFHQDPALEWAVNSSQDRVVTLAAQANALRWTILILLYGTTIPNTWKRCAVGVGILVAAPLILNFLVCFKCPVMGDYTWTAIFDMTVILAVAGAIAVFGSYKISTLHAEAFEAKKLGQYVLREKLGAGGMGEVFLGEHVLLRRACAIKVIRPDQAGDPRNLSRFEREVRATATLTHWNTVEIYDYGRGDDGTFYYVMEYLPGLSLQALVDHYGPLPAGRAIHFLRQVCAALKEAHHIGLIHRDIKPSNVLVCERGGVHDVVKLLDFGLVHGVDNAGLDDGAGKLTVQGAILGSPPYMSPEQAMSKPNIDARTDIYSLGALGYFLVTGHAPFVRDSAMEHLVAHLHDTPTPPRMVRPEVPVDLEEVLLRCLQKKPEDRYPDIAAVSFALSNCDAASEWDGDHADRWWQERPAAREREEEWVLK
jgi:serine/threonine-protein kinase